MSVAVPCSGDWPGLSDRVGRGVVAERPASRVVAGAGRCCRAGLRV